MDVAARLTSKGQVTIPKAVREALGLREGDQVIFRSRGTVLPWLRRGRTRQHRRPDGGAHAAEAGRDQLIRMDQLSRIAWSVSAQPSESAWSETGATPPPLFSST